MQVFTGRNMRPLFDGDVYRDLRGVVHAAWMRSDDEAYYGWYWVPCRRDWVDTQKRRSWIDNDDIFITAVAIEGTHPLIYKGTVTCLGCLGC